MPDQVTIKFGPAKLNTPKAIRNSIADTATQTKSDTIAEVTNNTSINVGGSVSGTVAQIATITTFDPYTNTGTATFNLDNINLNYINATGSYLNPGDEVVILEDTNKDYTAVAVYQRMPSVPGSIPAAGIAPGFPIDTSLAANLMGGVQIGDKQTITCIYDEQGLFSGYSDTILNTNTAQTISNKILNGYSRSISQSISSGINDISFLDSVQIQTNGRIWKHGYNGFSTSYKFYKDNPGSVWINANTLLPSGITTIATSIACDTTNGVVWFMGMQSSSPYNRYVYYVEPTSPAVAVQFGSAIPYNSGSTYAYNLFADNGYVYMLLSLNNLTTLSLYTKSSSNFNSTSDPFVVMCAVPATNAYIFQDMYNSGKLCGGIDNKLYAIRDTKTSDTPFPSTIFIDRYGFSGMSSFDTGLAINTSTNPSKVDSISVSPSGFLVITFATNASYFGMGTGQEWLPGVMITNFSSISYPFVDPAMMSSVYGSGDPTGSNQINKIGNSNIVKRSDGSMIWVVSTANTTNTTITLTTTGYTHKTRIYELTGL